MELHAAIQACRNDNPVAQKYVFDRFARQTYALCYRYVKNAEDAEELMLNAFQSFFKNIHRFHYTEENALWPWLKKIAVNECLMLLRKTKHFRLVPLNDKTLISIDEETIARLSAEELYQCILELPAGYRTIFNLYVIEGMSHKEIAQRLKITEGTSKSQLSRARSMLQNRIAKKEIIHKNKPSDE